MLSGAYAFHRIIWNVGEPVGSDVPESRDADRASIVDMKILGD